jgi:hypothetical protein
MKYLIILFFAACAPFVAISQCTLSGTGTINWDNTTLPTCQEGGDAGSATVIIIPAGVTLTFDTNTDTWTGVRIEVNGTLRILAPGQVTINSTIEVKDGGLLRIDSKLNIGSTSGCGYGLIIRNGGETNITGSTPDRLSICGTEIARGGTAGCNPYPDGPLPYCEPSSGFDGPVSFDETGVNNSLPITFLYFKVTLTSDNKARTEWATATEKNVSHFVIERSVDGKDFVEIGRVTAAGESSSKKEYSLIDDEPLIGKNYYRLKEVDFDGYIEHFNMKLLTVSGRKKISVYPNPAIDPDNITLSLNFSTDDKVYVTITDLSGRELKRFSFTGTETKIPYKPSRGTYLVTVTTSTDSYVTRFVIP